MNSIHNISVGLAAVVLSLSALAQPASSAPIKPQPDGHALTRDPKLENREILSTNAPLLGVSGRAPDGVMNCSFAL